MMNRRGVTVVDIVLLIAIGLFVLLNVALLDDVYDVHKREGCYFNQKNLDKVLWEICAANKREIWDVVEAYAIKYPRTTPPVMVVLFNSRLGAEVPEKEIVVVDLKSQQWTTEQTCPLNDGVLIEPAIDYWFAYGRWHCLFNRYHSE